MKKVIVIGSSNIDLVYQVMRLPQLGETIHGHDLVKLPGGKGLNQAIACSRVYDKTIFLGCLGNDKLFLDTFIKKEKLNTDYLLNSSTSTGSAIITLVNHDNTIVVIPGANDEVSIDYIKANIALFDKDTIVLLQNEIKQETNEFIINYCFENNIDVIYNPAPARLINKELLNKVTYFTPNESEASLIFNEDNLETIIKAYPQKVIITMGSKGVIYYDQEVVNIKAMKIDVVDTTGAGDTLNGILAAYLAQGYNLKDSLSYATKGASYACLTLGAQAGMPAKDFLEKE
ncbi:MAG: ribokinase [Bacilli bacterium]|jgi:ribokinase|nr:ribokinase [Bacilli bacterium]